MSMPYVNKRKNKFERLYISAYSLDDAYSDKRMLVYRPTHDAIGMFTDAEIIKIWNMSTKRFYRMLLGIPYFRLPRGGTYNFCQEGYYEKMEDTYYDHYLPTTEVFIRKYNLKRLYEDIPFEYMARIKSERVTRGGVRLRCDFNETGRIKLSGEYAEFADSFFDAITEFEGSTKKELFRHLSDYIDVDLFNVVLGILKRNGICGIAELKCTSKKALAKMLVNEMDSWRLYL